jgi:hypothetical protein
VSDRSGLDGHQTIEKDRKSRAKIEIVEVESCVVDSCIVSEWDEDGFMVDLATDAEEAQRKLLRFQGIFIAVLVIFIAS